MRIAVTGNIGAGKSTFVKRLVELLPDYHVFSTDDWARNLYTHDEDFLAAVEDMFGTTKRDKISDIVFNDPKRRKWLETASSTIIARHLVDVTRKFTNLIVEYPLAFEWGEKLTAFDMIISVTCDDDTRKQRVMARDGMTEEKFKRITEAQLDSYTKNLLADYEISTDSGTDDLELRTRYVVTKAREHELQERHQEIYSLATWKPIQEAYSEPHRHYHNLMHLHSMFAEFDQIEDYVENGMAIQQAIWFHDIVYSTRDYASNEQLSVRKMSEIIMAYARTWTNASYVSGLGVAAEMIMSTKNHEPTPYFTGHPDMLHDCQLFLDIDLSILGTTDQEKLMAYDDGVFKEFLLGSLIGQKEFAKGRVGVLKKFLARQKIFYTETFAPREAQARINLQTLIDKWEKLA